MEKNILKSQENLQKLKELSENLSLNGIRLMIDPQKTTSTEATIEDLCLYLEDKKNNMEVKEPLFEWSI